mmetsp:Transcript_14155/g.39597  ORF Transcript_14155/g.39597 Transcript_14155/m.39597 type:complete len:250 (-) Transcript_14155:774-1523(-)
MGCGQPMSTNLRRSTALQTQTRVGTQTQTRIRIQTQIQTRVGTVQVPGRSPLPRCDLRRTNNNNNNNNQPLQKPSRPSPAPKFLLLLLPRNNRNSRLPPPATTITTIATTPLNTTMPRLERPQRYWPWVRDTISMITSATLVPSARRDSRATLFWRWPPISMPLARNTSDPRTLFSTRSDTSSAATPSRTLRRPAPAINTTRNSSPASIPIRNSSTGGPAFRFSGTTCWTAVGTTSPRCSAAARSSFPI